MVAPISVPILQIRVIGPRTLVDQLAPNLAAAARTALGTGASYTIQTRTARRAGHIRLYLTATPKENPDANRTIA